jgi:hypothetical protein
MNRVAVKNEMIARRTMQVVVAHGLVTGEASRLRGVRQGHLSRTCAARYRVEVATLLSQGVQRSNRRGHVRQVPATLWRPWRHERSFLTQPFATAVLRAVCGVMLLAKGITISIVAFLASQSRKAAVAVMWDLIRGSRWQDSARFC